MTLAPCKHCGGAAKIVKGITDPHLCWSVSCGNCGITTAPYSQQDDAIEAWQRTAMYSHRNGEAEAPTIRGQYWFKGTIEDRTKAMICHVTEWPDDGWQVWDNTDYIESYVSIGGANGQWWGPVVPPWEASE